MLVSLCWCGLQLVHGGLGPSDTAGVLGIPIGLFGLIWSLRRPLALDIADQARAAAATLAKQVTGSEGSQLQALLGNDSERINLTYHLAPQPRAAQVANTAGRMCGDSPPSPAGAPASLPSITDFYRGTRPGRIVITGEPGAGKTVLALQLLLDLAKSRKPDEPVPVRMAMTEWDTAVPLSEQLVEYLVRAYQWPAAMALTLVEYQLVLPVLDGLDEMDPPLPGGLPDPDAPRALAALAALKNYQEGARPAPLVLTCRTAAYEALAAGAGVVRAARISIDPVPAPDARHYLEQRTSNPARWQPVLDTLQDYPHGLLARALSTPWRLCLAATVCADQGDPTRLLAFASSDALDDHLLASYLPVATGLHPDPGYAPDRVHHWLHVLAVHLANAPSPMGSSGGTDLVLHQLWPMAGAMRVRVADTILSMLVVTAPTMPLTLLIPHQVRLLVVLIIAVAAGAAGVAAPHQPMAPRRPRWRALTSWTWLRTRGAILVLMLAQALLFAFAAHRAGASPVLALAIGLPFVLLMGPAAALGGVPTSAAGPRDLIRFDSQYGCVYGVAIGVGTGLILGLGFGHLSRITTSDSLLVGLASGLALGLAAGLGASASRRYTVFLLCSRGRLPMRLGRFLDWATQADLLRLSGPAYQFRHRELQQWLEHNPTPPP